MRLSIPGDVLPSLRFAGLQWGVVRLAGCGQQALLSIRLETYSEETSMRRQRVPYAKRSAWTAIAILSAVIVVVAVIAGYEISHLQNEVNGLQNKLNLLLLHFGANSK